MSVQLHVGDCLRVLETLDANSVDSVICDPPYELGFMGKSWDSAGIAFDPQTWAAVLRVAKPGAFLLAFGGTRTFHRIACAIEDAGWELRDCMSWLYGSGFPKSLDIAKAIDKAAGAERQSGAQRLAPIPAHESTVYSETKGNRFCDACGKWTFASNRCVCSRDGGPATDLAKHWQGWGTALKPAWNRSSSP